MTKTQDEYKTRLDKLKRIQDQGIDPYPASVPKFKEIVDVLKLKLNAKNVNFAGRLTTIRTMGKLTFAKLQ